MFFFMLLRPYFILRKSIKDAMDLKYLVKNKEKCDEVLVQINAVAKCDNSYEYGLPLFDKSIKARLREVVYTWASYEPEDYSLVGKLEGMMPTFTVKIEFEVFASCTRHSVMRGTPKAIVEPCEDCLKIAREEAAEEMRKYVQEIINNIEHKS